MKHHALKLTQGLLCALCIVTVSISHASQRGFAAIVEGSGRVITENKQLPTVKEVSIAGIGELNIYQSAQTQLVIEVEDNIYPVLLIQNKEGHLTLGQQHASLELKHPIRYKLYAPNIRQINASGEAKVFVSDGIRVDQLNVNVIGAAKTKVRVLGSKLKVNIQGSGQMIADGDVEEQMISISGAGQFRGQHLRGTTGLVNISGSGIGQVNISDELDVRISGSGRVYYEGQPKLKQTVWDNGAVISQAS